MNTEILHRHISAMVRCFTDAGLVVSVDNDPEAYRAHVGGLLDYHLSTPLNIAFSKVARGNFIWVRFATAAGFTVGIECVRIVNAPWWRGGVRRLLRSQDLFATTAERPLPVISEGPHLNFSGKLAYLGGGWVHDAWRGKGIMSLAVKLVTAHAMRFHRIDHAFALIRSNHLSLALAENGYGFTSAVELPNAYWAGAPAPENLLLVSVQRSVLLRRLNTPAGYKLVPPPR